MSRSFSSGVGSAIASTTQPLSDILPWGSPLVCSSGPTSSSTTTSTASTTSWSPCNYQSRSLLITDSTSTDARFLLHTLALQYLQSAPPSNPCTNNAHDSTAPSTTLNGAVLWIHCGSPPLSPQLIRTALDKAMHHGLAGGPSHLDHLAVLSLPSELAHAALKSTAFHHESYLKRLHGRIIHWLHTRQLVSDEGPSEEGCRPDGPSLILIDGESTLAAFFGESLAHRFTSSVAASFKTFTRGCNAKEPHRSSSDGMLHRNTRPTVTVTHLLVLRCTSPDDGGMYHRDDLRSWLGMGSYGHDREEGSSLSLLYKQGWYERVDAIVDVAPLPSGYSRDVLGRISFTTTWNGWGWWGWTGEGRGTRYGSVCVNYRCEDGGVRVMRLRSGA